MDAKPISAMQQVDSTAENLKNNFNSLLNQIRQMPMPYFRAALDAPDYSEMRRSGFCTMMEGFRLSAPDDDVFIHALRDNLQCKGEFSGDKFHISVKEEQVSQAFQALSGLLFAKDSPIDKWKVTDMDKVEQQSRVRVGAQFTLYVKPDQENSQYSAPLLLNTRQFIKCLESMLSENGIIAGQYPESDVYPEHWKYVSYRNELRSGRDATERQIQSLRKEPFYRLMTE